MPGVVLAIAMLGYGKLRTPAGSWRKRCLFSQVQTVRHVRLCQGVTMSLQIKIPKGKIAEFCRQHHIRRLAVFGSALRPDFDEASDIDVLVEFDPQHIPGLFGMARMERELSALWPGRKVDLRTPEDLSRYFRQQVLDEAEDQYVRR